MVDTRIDELPTLHLDDFSEIPLIGFETSIRYLQQRARLRAGQGDFVALTWQVEEGYSDYCEQYLGLGKVNWLYACENVTAEPQQLAIACLQDRGVRNGLVHAIRNDGLRYVHPYISTRPVWAMADMLHRSARLPLKVIGPTPALTAWINNKIEFTAAAAELLGPQAVPTTESASNFASLSEITARLAETHTQLGIKFPYGVGGSGNFLVDATRIRGMTLAKTREYLKNLLTGHPWPAEGRVLIDVWETNVIGSPSVQTWIPPTSVGKPIIEELFLQSVQGRNRAFVGGCPLKLPAELEQKIVDSSFLLTVLFQELGYVGRCSFDLILTGETIDNCRFEFVECNARWGGSSLPMTLINRLNIGIERTFSVQKVDVPGLKNCTFKQVIVELGSDLYDPASGEGRFVLFSPAKIKSHSGVEAIAIADTSDLAEEMLSDVLVARLARVAQAASRDIPNNQPHSPG